MTGIRTDNIYRNIIDYILKEYDITVDNKERFRVNYPKDMKDESQEYLKWRNSGNIVRSERISYNFKYSVLCLEDTYYILLENYNHNFKIDFLEEIEFNLGHLIFLFKEKQHYPSLNPLKSSDDVMEVIDIMDDEYLTHEFEDINQLLLEIRIFKIESDCPFEFNSDNIENSINRILSLILIEEHKNKKFCYLTLDTLEEYKNIVMSDINYFSYENILLSLLEDKPSKVFLEIYRIIERLYPYIMIRKFKNIIKHKLKDEDDENIFLLNEALESINWNYKEENCIQALFSELDLKIEEDLQKIIIESSGSKMSLHLWIYRIRNTIVHLSINGTKKDINLKVALEKDYIILKILRLLPDLYRKCFY